MAGRSFGFASVGVPFRYIVADHFSQRVFYCAVPFLCLGAALETKFPAHIMVIVSAVSAAGIAATTINVQRYPVFAETIHFIGFALVILLGHLVVFTFKSELGRMRAASLLMMASKHFPASFFFRRVPCLLFLTLSVLLDWANGYLMLLYHSDEYTIRMGVNALLWACIYAVVALAQLSWITRVYHAENEIQSEKTAMERLLSLLCDCQILIHENGDTVLRSNPIFDSLTGKAVEATQLSAGTWISADDAERLRNAFGRARDEPVILPISIRGKRSQLHDVDLLIVSRGKDHTMARRNYKTDHGGGANGTDDKTVSSFLVGVRITNVRIADKGTLERDNSKEAANTLESAKANGSNGQMHFEDVEPTTCIDDDHIDNPSIGHSSTVRGLGSESLYTALKTGDQVFVKWLVPLTSITLLPRRILGSGGFGIVVCGKVFGTDVVVKLVKTNDPNVQKRLPSLLNELRALRSIHHPSVLHFFGACLDVDNAEIGLIFEKVSGVCLDRFVCGSPTTPEDRDTRCALICDIVGALRFLHAQEPSIVHSNVKPPNIMVESRGWESGIRPTAKLLDLGLARFVTRSAIAAGGTLQWIAPEILKDQTILLKPSIDVYSFGHLLFFLNTGSRPLEDVPPNEIVYLARLGIQEMRVWPCGVEPFAKDTKDLVARCVNGHPPARPPMEQVHIHVLQWTTHHTRDASLSQEEATWAEGLKTVRAGKSLAPTANIPL